MSLINKKEASKQDISNKHCVNVRTVYKILGGKS